MDLFEYQGKQYFASFGIPVSAGDVAHTVDESIAIAERIGYPVVVKAQVQVGGRGKAGGIKLAKELDDREKLARDKGLQYIGLDGSVGIIANGAGLAMSTLDVVNQVGGKAANFLDIGGGANAELMTAALEVINFDTKVRSIFINIFGGITRGDEVAKGIVEAMRRVSLRAPIVIRLDGTNADEGRRILAEAGIAADKLITKSTMLEAARSAVAIANGKAV
ncbi:MAG: hypothetical protein EBX87_05570 [Actinobacteria bacterium]|nr:hypothetical protein [Actinomycetota bacterium]